MRSKSSSFSSGGGSEGPIETIKLVLVGDPDTGKSTLLEGYRRGENWACQNQNGEGGSEPNPKMKLPVLEGFTKSVKVDGKEYLCLFWDTIGSKDFDKLRPLSYPKTDCFLICFAMDSPSSLENVTSVWIPELKAHAPDLPFILVGTKSDVRTLSAEDVSAVMSSTDALDYVETTAKDVGPSLEPLLTSGVKAIAAHKEKMKSKKDANGSGSLCRIL